MAKSTPPRRTTSTVAERLATVAGAAGAAPSAQRAIWAVVAALMPGQVAAYGEVARRAGLPRRARLVAQSLKAAPPALALPWHRVIRADGKIAFEPGSAAFRRQRRLLMAEGVAVAENGRVTPAKGDRAHTLDLDAAIWAP